MLAKLLSENSRLKTGKLFEGLTPEEKQLLNTSSVTSLYKKGEIIFKEGGIPIGIFYIKSGRVKKYKTTVNGGEQIIFICSEGELLGYQALLSEEYYPATAAVIEDSRIAHIPKEAFLNVLQSSTVLSNRLLKALGHEFILSINQITNLASKTVAERLATNLLILEEKFKVSAASNEPTEILMSRSDLANLVGTAKETLVRLLQAFKSRGLIETNGLGIRIKNREAVMVEANVAN